MKPAVKLIVLVMVMTFLWKHVFSKPGEGSGIKQLIGNGALLIDVRSEGEYAGGHVEGAINIPHNLVAKEIGKIESDPGKPIVLYCHSGIRSASAKKALFKAGYTNVVDAGGLSDMQREME